MPLFDIDRFVDDLYHDLTHDPDVLNGVAHAARKHATPHVLIPIAETILRYAEVGDDDTTAMMHRGLGTLIGTGVYLCQELVDVFIERRHVEQVVQFLDVQDLFFGDPGCHANVPLDPARLLLKFTVDVMPIIDHMSRRDEDSDHRHGDDEIATLILNVIAHALVWRYNAGRSTLPSSDDTPLQVPDDLV